MAGFENEQCSIRCLCKACTNYTVLVTLSGALLGIPLVALQQCAVSPEITQDIKSFKINFIPYSTTRFTVTLIFLGLFDN